MNRLGIESLNAGAPDLRLTGEHNRGSYVQRRRAQMAGGGITQIGKPGGLVEPGISKYGMFDFITDPIKKVYDKVVDDLIPNELKDPKVAIPLALASTKLLPEEMGKGWLGKGLETLGTKVPMLEPITTGMQNIGEVISGIPSNIGNIFTGGSDVVNQELRRVIGDPTLQGDYDIYGNKILEAGQARGMGSGIMDILFGPSQIGDQQVQWKVPLQIGLAAGAAQKAMSEGDVLPQDTTGINIADIRRRALTGSDPDLHFLPPASATTAYAQGGRIGYYGGGIGSLEAGAPDIKYEGDMRMASHEGNDAFLEQRYEYYLDLGWSPRRAAEQAQKDLMEGNFDPGPYAKGGRVAAQEGGLMNLGGMEKDYRQEGGFVPIGGQEKADDVPARLSKNEFVFTADAVRAAGGGDIDEGAAVMENLMENLEAGGKVSEESQGLEGAQEMFANTQRLQNRII